jgi:hypothetical protein
VCRSFWRARWIWLGVCPACRYLFFVSMAHDTPQSAEKEHVGEQRKRCRQARLVKTPEGRGETGDDQETWSIICSPTFCSRLQQHSTCAIYVPSFFLPERRLGVSSITVCYGESGVS